MKKKVLMLALVVAIAVALSMPVKADAACTVYGKVVMEVAYTTGEYIYVQPFTTNPWGSGWGYYFWVPNAYPAIISSASKSYVTGDTVYVSGNATSCPTSGTSRNGGTATYMANYRDY